MPPRVLFDTNVLLDVLLRRIPWLSEAQALWGANQSRRLTAFVCAISITDISYVVARYSDAQAAREAVQVCLDAFEILTVDGLLLKRAHRLGGTDFEDDVQRTVAIEAGLDAIVTRDAAMLALPALPVWSPAECLARLPAPDDEEQT